MLTEQQITELAESYVCPLWQRPTTSYEINAAKHFAEFARLILRIDAAQQIISGNPFEASAQVVDRYLAAYSIKAFTEPEPGQHGETVDACSARALRCVLPHIAEDIRRLAIT
jgi:hypothetical protein